MRDVLGLGQQCSSVGLPVCQDRGTLPISDKMPFHRSLQCCWLHWVCVEPLGIPAVRPFNLPEHGDAELTAAVNCSLTQRSQHHPNTCFRAPCPALLCMEEDFMFLLVSPSQWQAADSLKCAGGMSPAWQLLREGSPPPLPEVSTAEAQQQSPVVHVGQVYAGRMWRRPYSSSRGAGLLKPGSSACRVSLAWRTSRVWRTA